MLQRQREDISGAAAVMKGRWTMTRPSRALIESPPPPSPPPPLSQSTSLSRWHFGKSHCHTTFNKDKSLRRAAGDDWPDRARSWCAEYPSHTTSLARSRLRVFSTGRGPAMRVQNTAKTHKQVCASMHTHRWHGRTSTRGRVRCAEVCRFLFFFSPSSLDTVFMHIQHLPLTVGRLLPPHCQRSPGRNKRGGERGLRFLNQRKLVLITLPPKKHSDPVNPHAGCQLQTNAAKRWEGKPHTALP